MDSLNSGQFSHLTCPSDQHSLISIYLLIYTACVNELKAKKAEWSQNTLR